MTASELLRGLDKAATAGKWVVKDTGVVLSWSEMDGSGQEPPAGFRRAGPWNYRCGNVMCRAVFAADGSEIANAGTRPIDGDDDTDQQRVSNARCIATTRNLLPLLAGLVEACDAYRAVRDFDGAYDARQVLFAAVAALNAAAAKEVK